MAVDTSFRGYFRAVNPQAPIIERLLALLREKYDYVLVGAHARNAYAEPRATSDLDVILPDEQARTFAREAATLVPKGEVKERGKFVKVLRGRKPIVDIGFTSAHPLFERALAGAAQRGVPALGKARVAAKEMLIALKLLSALSPARRYVKARQDEVDALMLLEKRIDRGKLLELLALVPGGAERLAELERGYRSSSA